MSIDSKLVDKWMRHHLYDVLQIREGWATLSSIEGNSVRSKINKSFIGELQGGRKTWTTIGPLERQSAVREFNTAVGHWLSTKLPNLQFQRVTGFNTRSERNFKRLALASWISRKALPLRSWLRLTLCQQNQEG